METTTTQPTPITGTHKGSPYVSNYTPDVTLYDVIWFAPKHEAWALEHLRQLPESEIQARRLETMRGLTINPENVPMIDGQGYRQPGRICAVWANTLGSCCFSASAHTIDRAGGYRLTCQPFFESLTVIEDGPEGIVGGIFKDDLRSTPTWRKASIEHATRDMHRLTALQQSDRTPYERTLWWISSVLKGLAVAPITLMLTFIAWIIQATAWLLFDIPALILSQPAVMYRRRKSIEAAARRDSVSPLARAQQSSALCKGGRWMSGADRRGLLGWLIDRFRR